MHWVWTLLAGIFSEQSSFLPLGFPSYSFLTSLLHSSFALPLLTHVHKTDRNKLRCILRWIRSTRITCKRIQYVNLLACAVTTVVVEEAVTITPVATIVADVVIMGTYKIALLVDVYIDAADTRVESLTMASVTEGVIVVGMVGSIAASLDSAAFTLCAGFITCRVPC
ncbi:hypothetical protein GWI33_013594 [Rhynchophorus ferrugineus]|uniref:Uncharacterized protein n=1 Tax=Rhynchophorus ferrugineus TaxID=354439 RepID=A0A834I664_RHYFE|nr:hypothetical protein GWI33_013594 [Rhynchophorus ferrugineus]